MVDDNYKSKVKEVIEKAKQKGKIKTYSEFCKTDLAEKTKVSEEETKYFINKSKENK